MQWEIHQLSGYHRVTLNYYHRIIGGFGVDFPKTKYFLCSISVSQHCNLQREVEYLIKMKDVSFQAG